MNLIKLEEVTGFILSLIILVSVGLLASGIKFEVNSLVLLLVYIIAAIKIVLSTYNRGDKVNRIISSISGTVLMMGLILGIIAFI